MKKVLFLFIIMTLLVGCNKDYTEEDADKLNQSLGIKDTTLISTEELENDTIWTYKENRKDGLTYHIVENHYTTGIDASTWEESELYSDYDILVLEKYLLDQNVPKSWDEKKVSRYEDHSKDIRRSETFHYTFTDRKTLLKDIETVEDFIKNFKAYKRSLSIKDNKTPVTFQFQYDGNFYFSYDRKYRDDIEKVDEEFLKYLYAYYDTNLLTQYTDQELNRHERKSDAHILVNGEKTKYTTLYGNTYLYGRALYHICLDHHLHVEGNEETFTLSSKTIQGEDFISFHDASMYTGLTISGEWQ